MTEKEFRVPSWPGIGSPSVGWDSTLRPNARVQARLAGVGKSVVLSRLAGASLLNLRVVARLAAKALGLGFEEIRFGELPDHRKTSRFSNLSMMVGVNLSNVIRRFRWSLSAVSANGRVRADRFAS